MTGHKIETLLDLPLFVPRAKESASQCDAELGDYYVPMLFTENEANTQRPFSVGNSSPYVKDDINNYVVHGETSFVNPALQGTKVALQYQLNVEPGECQVLRLSLAKVAPRR